jgi:hypothetical protein
MPHSKTLTYLIGDIADTTVSSHMQKDHEEVLKILQKLMSRHRLGEGAMIQAADSLTILLSIARVDTLIKSLEEDKKEIVRKLMRMEKEGVDFPQKGD